MDEWFGKTMTLNGGVKFIGDPENDPMNNPYFVCYVNAIKSIYQPERLNPEDVRNDVCDSLTSTNK